MFTSSSRTDCRLFGAHRCLLWVKTTLWEWWEWTKTLKLWARQQKNELDRALWSWGELQIQQVVLCRFICEHLLSLFSHHRFDLLIRCYSLNYRRWLLNSKQGHSFQAHESQVRASHFVYVWKGCHARFCYKWTGCFDKSEPSKICLWYLSDCLEAAHQVCFRMCFMMTMISPLQRL